MRKLVLSAVTLLSLQTSFGALNGLSHHSRANCIGFNESVSWDATQQRFLGTCSIHYNGWTLKHWTNHDNDYLYRSASYHYYSEWDYYDSINRVIGWHWMKLDGVNWKVEVVTDVRDCNIYDGWWNTGETPDKDHTILKSII